MTHLPAHSASNHSSAVLSADLDNAEIREAVAQRIRAFLRTAVAEEPAAEYGEGEIESHFSGMPQRYWLGVGVETCCWHLSALHHFFRSIAEAEATTTSPVLRWRRCSEQDVTEVVVCSWDRPGLLMNIAGALSRAGFDILRADAYTRRDHVVLDAFEVREIDGRSTLHEVRLKYASRLLNAAMAAPHAVPAATTVVPMHETGGPDSEVACVSIDNETSSELTIVKVEAKDQPSLLFRILEALAANGTVVEQATIATIKGRARDEFFVTDAAGQKISDPACLERIVRTIRESVAKSDFGLSVWGADPLNIIDQHDWSGGNSGGGESRDAAVNG